MSSFAQDTVAQGKSRTWPVEILDGDGQPHPDPAGLIYRYALWHTRDTILVSHIVGSGIDLDTTSTPPRALVHLYPAESAGLAAPASYTHELAVLTPTGDVVELHRGRLTTAPSAIGDDIPGEVITAPANITTAGLAQALRDALGLNAALPTPAGPADAGRAIIVNATGDGFELAP